MVDTLIAKRYANALSRSTKDLEKTLENLNTLSGVVASSEVNTILLSPIVSIENKRDLILLALEGSDDTMLINFVNVLAENGRLALIPAITQVLNSDKQRQVNVYDGVVVSGTPLNDEALANLEETLKRHTGSTIHLSQEQSDREGLRVVVDDLGIEVNFSKQRVKEQLIDFIKKSL
jgi:F-type H+-transporting ATPase subunit delta